MSNNINPSIEILPVELLHRIFDYLDIETIIFSVRSLCRLFQSIVSNYNRYDLNLNLISKRNFYIICRIINPQNVISLILSNDERTLNQIDWFISLVRLEQFTRLRSLTLLHIDENHLNVILTKINLNLLQIFSLKIKKYDETYNETTVNLLTSIFARLTLRKLDIDIKMERISKISWPSNCTIQYLTINNSINIDYLSKIFQNSSHLHTLIMNNIPTEIINNLTSTCFQQLSSLIIKRFSAAIDKLESFLLMTPSLVYLKLIGGEIMDGKRWEEFIKINLPQLDKFEFHLFDFESKTKTQEDLELIISSFQTQFWIEHKKWFVTCESYSSVFNISILYSIPICRSSLVYETSLPEISLSTYPMTMNKNSPSIMDNITFLSLMLNKSLADDIQEKVCYLNKMFHITR
jgi:hypothetical protein